MSKVLVIDDDLALRHTLEAALQFFGYEVAVEAHGEEGIRKARDWMPDVILCDVNMPGMDGRAVLQALRSDPQLATRQIVLMTGNQVQNTQREGMNLGADDYLPKPFELLQLQKCVEARLRRAEVHRRLETGMVKRHAELFGSTLPHEFMTPLNGILGFTEILKEDLGKASPEDARQMLADIESCARRLYRTLKNYISLVSLESEAADVRVLPPALTADAAAATVEAAVAGVAEKAGRMADVTTAIEPIALVCRNEDLRTIVEHVVENAFSFSAEGTSVAVVLKREKGSPVLSVTDRGRGMAAEQIAQIGHFMQFDRQRFEQQGLGIGLALVKGLLKRNGGRFRVESAPNQGTTVWIEFRPAA